MSHHAQTREIGPERRETLGRSIAAAVVHVDNLIVDVQDRVPKDPIQFEDERLYVVCLVIDRNYNRQASGGM